MEINVSQITVVWNVDHLKVSRKEPFEVTRLSTYLTEIYGGLKVDFGRVYEYLGMDLDYSEEVILKVSMIKYLNNILREFPKTLETLASSPADDHIFKVIPYIETK